MEIIIPDDLGYPEEWRNLKVEGFEHYQVSNYGRIRNGESGRLRKPKDNGRGYCQVALKRYGQQRYVYIHREVARAFLPDFAEELQVNHIDKDKTHNYVSNLAMVTDNQNKAWSRKEYIEGHLKVQGKIVQVYDLDGNLVFEHLGLWDLCRKYHLDPRSIQRNIIGRKKTYHGLIFKYREIG